MDEQAAFYEDLGDGRFRATGHTAGPWSDKAQHLGPVSALLVRELERREPVEGTAIRRVGIDVLGPVPVDELTVRGEVLRPGRSVQLISAELAAGGRVCATARAWRMVRGDSSPVSGGQREPLGDPESWPAVPGIEDWDRGYSAAMEWRAGPSTTGHAQMWARQRIPLVASEQPSPLQRLFAVVDSSSGVSRRASMSEWSFANTDLTVHLHREPAGEWIGVDAETTIGPDGSGTAASIVHDEHGSVARSAQALLVTPR
ncbi:thioesterase family protein [Saccharopolyspora sp. NFXS83]|uniref:thioesterase family protein n=1 Tax=Saccharopolyspora sp. NFXS83 TaxID=2993560 RepID=UPI00224B8824|nr:thioesterase family protein [Saccharopolyspora sp. NFXS83]MCX2732814.1 thioesterase family protein [Saccharopolyspora sp. NFXS83]